MRDSKLVGYRNEAGHVRFDVDRFPMRFGGKDTDHLKLGPKVKDERLDSVTYGTINDTSDGFELELNPDKEVKVSNINNRADERVLKGGKLTLEHGHIVKIPVPGRKHIELQFGTR